MTALDEYWELWLRVRDGRTVELDEYRAERDRRAALWYQMTPRELSELRRRSDDWYFKRACEMDKNPTLVDPD